MTQLDVHVEHAAEPSFAPLTSEIPPHPRPGRKRDHTRDPEILDAAIEVLAETGYDGMTIDMVAARAKAGKATLYRRWPSKSDLVIDAVACMKKAAIDWTTLPDTGTLRGDLVAMIHPPTVDDSEKRYRVMAGLVSMLSRNPELADAAQAAIVEPRAQVTAFFLRRAIERGEISAGCDVETLAVLTPSMVAFRVLILRKPVDRHFLENIIDNVLMPAVGLGPSAREVRV